MLVIVAAVAAAVSVRDLDLTRFEFAAEHMGTTFRIVVFAPDSATAADGAGAAFAVVARLDGRLSDWDPESELSRLGEVAGTGVGRPVSRELWRALSLARHWAERTDGAFDPTVGPLTRLWRWSARRGELPDSARLAQARASVGWRHLGLVGGTGTADAEDGAPAGSGDRVVRLERPGMALDLGGIAKGLAADAALAELARRDLHAALVDAGGDIALGSPPPGRTGWTVGVDDGHGTASAPSPIRPLAHVGIATSGDRYRSFEVDGVRYSHIIDPRTGLGVSRPRSVTVIAPDATTADVLASALSVLDPAAGRTLVDSLPGVRVHRYEVEGLSRRHGRDNSPGTGASR